MPRYFFHIANPEYDTILDDEGMSFHDDAAARREAILSLGEMMREAASTNPTPFCVSVQVFREGIGIIETVTGHVFSQPDGRR